MQAWNISHSSLSRAKFDASHLNGLVSYCKFRKYMFLKDMEKTRNGSHKVFYSQYPSLFDWDLIEKEHVLFRKHMFLKEMKNLEMHLMKFSSYNIPVFFDWDLIEKEHVLLRKHMFQLTISQSLLSTGSHWEP